MSCGRAVRLGEMCDPCRDEIPMPTRKNSRLREHQGGRCPKCHRFGFEHAEKCPECGSPLEPGKYYTRTCVERWAFVGTVVALITLVTGVVSPENTLWALLLSAWLIPAAYGTASYFMGIGQFTERFDASGVPPRAFMSFSWGRYLMEFVYFVGIIVALFLFVGAVKLFQWAFSDAI